MQRGKRDTLLGLVFFGTLILLLWATVSLTDLRLGDVPTLDVFFADAGGIQAGDPVQLRGKRIGKVGELEYRPSRPERPMLVPLLLDEQVPLHVGYTITIQDRGLLGGKVVQIFDGDPAKELLPPGTELHGEVLGNALERVGDFFVGQGPAGEELLGLLREAHAFGRNINDPTTTIGALVRRRELYDELLGSVQSLKRLFQSIEAGDGLLGRIIKDATMREDGMRILANLRLVSEQLTGTDGTMGMLLNSRQLAQRLEALVTDVADIVADTKGGQGMLGVILRDPAMATQFRQAVADLAGVLHKANDPGAGALGAILGDQQLADDFKILVSGLRQVADKLNTSQGVLGVLINDQDLATRLRRIFTQISGAIEDAREAAPIGTFVQVLVGAF